MQQKQENQEASNGDQKLEGKRPRKEENAWDTKRKGRTLEDPGRADDCWIPAPELLATSLGGPELSQIPWFPLGSGKCDQEQEVGKTGGISALCLLFHSTSGSLWHWVLSPTPVAILPGKKASVIPCGRGL